MPLLLISLLLSCKSDEEKKEAYFEDEIKPKLVEKYDCYNIDYCLSKYEFQGAREFASETSAFKWSGDSEADSKKIITSESAFWLDKKEYDRAFKTVKEFDENDIFEIANIKNEFNILDDIISSLLSDGNIDEAYAWALKATNIKDPSGYGLSTGTMSQQQVLLGKIETAEKVLKRTKR